MGWNSWNNFACHVDEDKIRKQADSFIEFGLDKLGYKYINIDDCWQMDYRQDRRLVVDFRTFPSGLKALGDYIHSKGLLFGIHSTAGTRSCEGREGSLFYEFDDAMAFAAWGVDYIKYDNCNPDMIPAFERFDRMRAALNSTGRPILYSMCSWGLDEVWLWAN